VSTLEFEKGIENNEFLEHAIVHKTDYYGTKLKEVVEE
jgi:guanylate kinase